MQDANKPIRKSAIKNIINSEQNKKSESGDEMFNTKKFQNKHKLTKEIKHNEAYIFL